jgi:hypothetical protein
MAGPTQAPAPFNYADAWAEGEQMLARAGRIE